MNKTLPGMQNLSLITYPGAKSFSYMVSGFGKPGLALVKILWLSHWWSQPLAISVK